MVSLTFDTRVKGLQSLILTVKLSILDVCGGPGHASEIDDWSGRKGR